MYFTTHKMLVKNVPNVDAFKKLEKLLQEAGLIGDVFTDGKYNASEHKAVYEPDKATTWYSNEQDIQQLSAKFPEYLFEVMGQGESFCDLWLLIALNGDVELIPAEIRFTTETSDINKVFNAGFSFYPEREF